MLAHSIYVRKGTIMFKTIIVGASLAILSSGASATDAPRFYAGGDIGTTKEESFSHRENGYGVFAGVQFTRHVALEAGYRRIADQQARFNGIAARAHSDQLALSAVGTLALSDKWSVLGRLGVNRLTAKGNFGSEEFSEHSTRGLYGVGMVYNFTPVISARVELQKPMPATFNLSAGVAFRF